MVHVPYRQHRAVTFSIVVFAIGFPIFAIIASYKKWWGLQSIAMQYTQLEQKRW